MRIAPRPTASCAWVTSVRRFRHLPTRPGPGAALIHADVGSGDKAAGGQLAAALAPYWARILAPGGFLACDQAVDQAGLASWPLPAGVDTGRYYLYQRSA